MTTAVRPLGASLVDVAAKASAIFVRDAKLAVSYGANFALVLASVAVSVIMAYFISRAAGRNPHVDFGGPDVTYFGYLAVNLAFVRYQSTALISFADVIRDNQTTGTLEITLATPTGLPTLVLSSGLWAFTFCSLQTAIYLAVAGAFGLSFAHVNLPLLVCVLLLTILCSSPLGVLAAAMAIVFKKTGPIDFFMQTTTMVFGGVYLPISALPHVLAQAAWWFPISHALAAIRVAMGHGTFASIAGDLVWLSVATIVLMPLALYVFVQAVRAAKMDGTLHSY